MTAGKARPRGVLVVAVLMFILAIAVPICWISFFSGSSQITNETCYLTFESAFLAADTWLAIAALLACVGLLRRKPWGVLFSLLAGSSAFYLGLMDLLFDIEYGIYSRFSVTSSEVVTEIAIVVVLLTVAPAIVWYVWTRRLTLL